MSIFTIIHYFFQNVCPRGVGVKTPSGRVAVGRSGGTEVVGGRNGFLHHLRGRTATRLLG